MSKTDSLNEMLVLGWAGNAATNATATKTSPTTHDATSEATKYAQLLTTTTFIHRSITTGAILYYFSVLKPFFRHYLLGMFLQDFQLKACFCNYVTLCHFQSARLRVLFKIILSSTSSVFRIGSCNIKTWKSMPQISIFWLFFVALVFAKLYILYEHHHARPYIIGYNVLCKAS